MKWKQFSNGVSQERYSNTHSTDGTISRLIIHHGQVSKIKPAAHKWYPKGVKNNEWFEGYRYVDMNHSYYGTDPLILSEASCCIIVLLLDLQNNQRFAAHICASSASKSLYWLHMEFDFWRFFKKNNYNLNHIECYFFSNNLYKNNEGSFEQRNIMRLFLSALNNDQLQQIASSAYLIEGENGQLWNPHCAIRLGNNINQTMDISFTH